MVFALPDPTHPSNQHVWTVEDGGRIRYSHDGGQTWSFATTPEDVRDALLDVFFLNPSEGWACGKQGVVLHSTDGGATWEQVGSTILDGLGNPATLWRIRFVTPDRGYLVGEELFRSTLTGGANWSTVSLYLDSSLTTTTPETDWEFYSIDVVQVGGQFLGLASEQAVSTCPPTCPVTQGIVFRTTDGARWYRVEGLPATIDPSFEAWDVDIEPNPTSTSTASAYLVGGTDTAQGRIFSSFDGGATWSEELHECTVNPPPVCPSSPCPPTSLWPCKTEELGSFATIYAVTTLGHEVAIGCSYGGGIFRRQSSPTVLWQDVSDRCRMTGPLTGAVSTDSRTAWVVGTFGCIQKTKDAGVQFANQNRNGGTPLRLHDVAFVNSRTGWAVGEGSVILKTTDGGCSFSLEQALYCVGMPAHLGPSLSAIAATGSYGVAVGDLGTIYYRDQVGSSTWTEVMPHPTAANLHGVEHVGTSEFWAVGDNSTVLRSLDGGISWAAVGSNALPSGLTLDGVGLVNSDNAFVVGLHETSGVAYRVRGASTSPLWNSVTPQCPSGSIPELLDVDTRGSSLATAEVYAVGRSGAVFQWNYTANLFQCVPNVYAGCACMGTSLTTKDLHTVELVQGSSGIYAAGDSGVILRYSPVTGWTLPKSSTTKDLLGMSFVSSTQGYVAGQTLVTTGSSDNNGDSVLLIYY